MEEEGRETEKRYRWQAAVKGGGAEEALTQNRRLVMRKVVATVELAVMKATSFVRSLV